MRFIDEENQIVVVFDFIDDTLDSFFKHSAKHCARDNAAHLKLDHVRTAQARWHLLGLEFDQARYTLDHRCLPHTGLTNQHRRIGTLAMTKNLDDLLDLFFSANRGRNLVSPRQAIKGHTKML